MASKKAIVAISKLLEHTTTQPIPVESLDVWVKVLEPLSDELAIAAAMQVVRTERRSFAVAPGAIYQAALEVLGREELSAGEAWQSVLAVVRGDDFVQSLPTITADVVDQLGGWTTLGELKIGDTTTRAHFLQLYRAHKSRVINKQVRELGSGSETLSIGDETDRPLLPYEKIARARIKAA